MFTNLIAVPLSGPILILGLLGSVAGNIYPLIAYPLNACNGFLVTMLIQTAQGSSSLPFASVTTPGVTLFPVGLFYALRRMRPPDSRRTCLLERTQVPVGCSPPNLVRPLVGSRRRR